MRSLVLFLTMVAGVFTLPKPGNLAGLSAIPSGSYLPGLHSTTIDTSGTFLPGVISPIIQPSISTSGFDTTLSHLSNLDGYANGGALGYVTGHGHQDQKSVYFYSAPDDEPAARLKVYIEPTSQKHTRVIFIKAPGAGGVIPEVIAPPSEAIDRTKVYVLVRKPEHGGSVTVPASLGVKQAQPEVFFIKYKNEHDAAAAVNHGLQGAAVGAPLENLGNEQSFVRSLETHRVGIAGSISSHGSTTISGGAHIINDYHDGAEAHKVAYGPPGVSGPYKKK